ncbi:MAG: ribosome-associated translation inhibitor RaiA [Candidatus Saccharimonadaceae bacterium]|nr:ribosome-associated translation inhibitor RaiA [Candidatus Saccharimonadaceae bacterium]
MITSIQVTGIAYEVDEPTKKYVIRKVGRLDRYLPRHARKSAKAEVKLSQVNRDFGNKYEAEIILNIPDKIIIAKDSTGNILAAVDIVEAKIRSQLREYKETNIAHIGNRGVMSRFKRSFKREL